MKIKLIYKIRSDANFEKHRDSIIEIDNGDGSVDGYFVYDEDFFEVNSPEKVATFSYKEGR